jgi:hypothetical protein
MKILYTIPRPPTGNGQISLPLFSGSKKESDPNQKKDQFHYSNFIMSGKIFIDARHKMAYSCAVT